MTVFQATPKRQDKGEVGQAELALASDVLLRLQEEKLIAPLDRYTGLMLCRHADKYSLMICALATVLSHCRGEGHTCLELDGLDGSNLWLRLADSLGLGDDFDALADSLVVGTVDDDLPLLLDGSRLYFQKMLRAEVSIVDKINEIAVKNNENGHKTKEVVLDGISLDDLQRRAVATARANAFCLISGGPGTGKTTVAAAILSDFLAEQNDAEGARETVG